MSILTDIIKLSSSDILSLSNVSMELTLSTIKNGDYKTAKINHLFNAIYFHAYHKEWSIAQQLLINLEELTKWKY